MENKELESILKSKYDIDALKVEKNNESTDGNVYIITDIDQKKYVIKVYRNHNHAKSMVELHTYINQIGLIAPSIIKNNENNPITKKDNDFIVCYSFVEGIKLKQTDLTSKRIEEIASYLRKLHSIKENIFNLEAIPYKVQAERESVLHFDITKNNIFINQDKICFIDFDDAKFGPSVCDAAIAATNLFISKANGLDSDGMKLFIDIYYQDNIELKGKELPLIKEAAINWLESIIDNSNFDTSTRSGLENKLRIWNEIDL